MERKEENNMFKYATKELSQDAFICWCINWLNYPSSKFYNLGKEMLKKIIFPNVEDNGLYPNYNKTEIIEKYDMFSSKIKDNINEEIKATQQEQKELDKIYDLKNSEVDLIKKDLKQQAEELKPKIDLDKIENLKIIRQFKYMAIVITVNKEYVIIIEDKVDGTTNQQLKRYVEIFDGIVNENNTNTLNLLELDVKKFDSNKIIPVYMKTGKATFDEKAIVFRRINGKVILNVLEKYKNEDDRIRDFYECLRDKISKEDDEKYIDIVNNGYIKVGEKFSKRYMIYNCFTKYIKNIHISNKHLNQRGAYFLPNTEEKIRIWTPRFFDFEGWINTLSEDENEITEERKDKIEDTKMNNEDTRYVFARKRDLFNQEYFEFIGVFYLDLTISTNNKRIYKKFNTEKATLDIKELMEQYRNLQ